MLSLIHIFPNEDGGIVDDLLVYHYEPEKYLLVVNAANMDKDWDWCVSHNTEGAELENSSLMSVIGVFIFLPVLTLKKKKMMVKKP